jgi:hypothetical protein
MRRPAWTGTATPVSRPGAQARKIFVFDSIVVVRNPGGTLSPSQSSAEIVGERRQRAAMHMAAVVEMTVIDIEFADQLILVGVSNADAEVFRHTGTGRSRGDRCAPIRGKE